MQMATCILKPSGILQHLVNLPRVLVPRLCDQASQRRLELSKLTAVCHFAQRRRRWEKEDVRIPWNEAKIRGTPHSFSDLRPLVGAKRVASSRFDIHHSPTHNLGMLIWPRSRPSRAVLCTKSSRDRLSSTCSLYAKSLSRTASMQALHRSVCALAPRIGR
jgi:hypothetical protein